MAEWITDRPPTEVDGDCDGDVYVRYSPSDEMLGRFHHWSYVKPGMPWRHASSWTPPGPVPAASTTQPRRFVSINRTILGDEDHILDAIADDGTAWFLHGSRFSTWMPLRPLPAYEVPAGA